MHRGGAAAVRAHGEGRQTRGYPKNGDEGSTEYTEEHGKGRLRMAHPTGGAAFAFNTLPFRAFRVFRGPPIPLLGLCTPESAAGHAASRSSTGEIAMLAQPLPDAFANPAQRMIATMRLPSRVTTDAPRWPFPLRAAAAICSMTPRRNASACTRASASSVTMRSPLWDRGADDEGSRGLQSTEEGQTVSRRGATPEPIEDSHCRGSCVAPPRRRKGIAGVGGRASRRALPGAWAVD